MGKQLRMGKRSAVGAGDERHGILSQGLTTREREILLLTAKQKSVKEIAVSLAISPKTVDNLRTRMMARLNIHTLAGLVMLAVQLGLTDLPE